MDRRPNQELINNLQQTLFVERAVATSIYPADSVREKLEAKCKSRMYEELRLKSFVSYVGNKNIPLLRIYR